jgi:hypothetical protein
MGTELKNFLYYYIAYSPTMILQKLGQLAPNKCSDMHNHLYCWVE